METLSSIGFPVKEKAAILTDAMDWSAAAEIRLWLTLILLTFGGYITVRTYVQNQRQRQFENSRAILDLFWRTISSEDLRHWKHILQGAGEPAGPAPGCFVGLAPGSDQPTNLGFEELFAEGPPDSGAIERMAELFDLISEQALLKTIDLRIIYFELGQLMDSIHQWLSTIQSDSYASFIGETFPSFDRLYQSGLIKKEWKCRTHAHCE